MGRRKHDSLESLDIDFDFKDIESVPEEELASEETESLPEKKPTGGKRALFQEEKKVGIDASIHEKLLNYTLRCKLDGNCDVTIKGLVHEALENLVEAKGL